MGFEMIFIFLLALIILGPKKLPEMAREIGKFMAEFRRASNDFKYQLQNEIQNATTDTPPVAPPAANAAGENALAPLAAAPQHTTSFTQTLLPPAVKSAISDIDNAHERLMRTARMAFDAQNFTLHPPEPAAPEVEEPPATPVEPGTSESATAAPHESSPVEAPTEPITPASAPANSNSAPQSS
jgi:sec-independent protein translocase protein TatB